MHLGTVPLGKRKRRRKREGNKRYVEIQRWLVASACDGVEVSEKEGDLLGLVPPALLLAVLAPWAAAPFLIHFSRLPERDTTLRAIRFPLTL